MYLDNNECVVRIWKMYKKFPNYSHFGNFGHYTTITSFQSFLASCGQVYFVMDAIWSCPPGADDVRAFLMMPSTFSI